LEIQEDLMPHVVILPHVIERKLKVEERQEVLTFINDIIADTSSELKRDVLEIVEEKFERRLSEEILNLKTELIERIAVTEAKMANLETRLSERIASLETRLSERISSTETKMANNKAEMIKWMFIFWIGNIITIVGGIVGILKIAKVF
jgi:hypothetical protein